MEVLVLVGGRGTRMGQQTNKPKCLVTIGGVPIVRHIMDIYAAHGHTQFTLAAGWKDYLIRQFFKEHRTPYSVEVVKTGPDTETGGRLKAISPQDAFMATYGDGVGDIDITHLLEFHRAHGKLATVTAVRPPARFGHLEIEDGRVVEFSEKPQAGEGWISGGFFVLEPAALDYIKGNVAFEREPLANLARDGQLMAYQHEGFWQPMDTMRERDVLEALWQSGSPPWRIDVAR